MLRGLAVDRGAPGRGPVVNRGGGGRVAPVADGLDPLLAEAVVLLRAAQFAGVDGDDWVNEGTGGSAYDAGTFGTTAGDPGDPDPPAYVTSPEPGFVCGSPDGTHNVPPHFEVPNGAAIDVTTGSFTVAWRGSWGAVAQGVFVPIIAKLTGTIGVDGHGWWVGDGSAIGGAGVALANGAAFAAGLSGAALSEGDHLLVARLDGDADEVTFFVDGTGTTPADSSGVTTVGSTNPIIIGRSTDREQTVRDVVFWDRALTDTEVTVDLPAALGA